MSANTNPNRSTKPIHNVPGSNGASGSGWGRNAIFMIKGTAIAPPRVPELKTATASHQRITPIAGCANVAEITDANARQMMRTPSTHLRLSRRYRTFNDVKLAMASTVSRMQVTTITYIFLYRSSTLARNVAIDGPKSAFAPGI